MSRRIVIVLGCMVALASAAPAAAQDLPEYTPDQRWARTEYLANSWVVMAIHYAKLKGDSVEQFTQAVFEAFDPGWSMAMGPQEIMRAMNRNWSTYRGAQVEVVEATPDRVQFKMNRPYSPFFANGEVNGVTIGEYERMLALFQEKICAKRGMSYQQIVEGDWITVTIAKR